MRGIGRLVMVVIEACACISGALQAACLAPPSVVPKPHEKRLAESRKAGSRCSPHHPRSLVESHTAAPFVETLGWRAGIMESNSLPGEVQLDCSIKFSAVDGCEIPRCAVARSELCTWQSFKCVHGAAQQSAMGLLSPFPMHSDLTQNPKKNSA